MFIVYGEKFLTKNTSLPSVANVVAAGKVTVPIAVAESITCNLVEVLLNVILPVLTVAPPITVEVVAKVPLVVGKVSVVVPDTAGEDNVTLPDVEPLSIRLAII
jgi:hypothetical protein